MNAKDMDVIKHYVDILPELKVATGYTIAYRRGEIVKADINTDLGKIDFYFRNNDFFSIRLPEIASVSTPYNSSLGLSVTLDGNYFFVQNWESGLFCFETRTGALSWHNKKKKAAELVVIDHEVICHFRGKCIERIDVATGNTLRTYPVGSQSIFQPLNDTLYLIGPKQKKYIIIDHALTEFRSIPQHQVNPHQMSSFIVRDAQLTSTGISISGVEYSGEALRAAIESKSVDTLIQDSTFVREVLIDLSDK